MVIVVITLVMVVIRLVTNMMVDIMVTNMMVDISLVANMMVDIMVANMMVAISLVTKMMVVVMVTKMMLVGETRGHHDFRYRNRNHRVFGDSDYNDMTHIRFWGRC